MKKILSLVLALVMAFGSYSFGAMDTTEGYDAVGNELKGLGIIQGADEGALNSLSKLTRQDAIVILSRLMGKESDAKETKAQSGYADVPAGFYEPYIAYAKAMNWTNGVSENKFGFGEDVTAKQFVTFALRGLGYTVDWATEDVMKKATELGLLQDVNASENAPIIRGEVFKVMKNTLYTVPNGGDKKLVYVLGLKDESTGEVLPDPEKPVVTGELEVVDVKATNLKQIVVEFNQAVKRESISRAVTLVYNNILEVDLSEDKAIATLTVSNKLVNNKNYKITLNGVEAVDGAKLEKVVKEFKAMDVEVPVAEELKVTGPRTFTINFSEPLVNGPTVKVKTDKSSWATATVDHTKGSSSVEVKSNSFVDGKVYQVLVTKAEDYAGYSNIDKIFEFEYAKDNNAPVLTVEKANQKVVVVTFDKPVKGLKIEDFYHTYSAWKPLEIYSDAKLKSAITSTTKSYDKVYIEFAKTADNGKPLQAGEVKFYAVGSFNGVKVVDNWGNQLQDTMVMLNIESDTTSPVAETAEVVAADKIKVTFSEKVEVESKNFELLDNNGKKYSGVGISTSNEASDEQEIQILGVDLDGKTVTLNVSGVKDNSLAQNRMVGVASFTLTFEDKTFEGLKQAFLFTKEGYKTLMVEFEEAVDPETATNAKNYRFSVNDGSQFSLDTEVTMYNDKTVQFDLGKESDAKSLYKTKGFSKLTSGKVYVSNKIKDLAGNSPSKFELSQDISKEAPETKALSKVVDKATAKSTTEVEISLDDNAQADELHLNKFKVTQDNNVAITVVSVELVDSKNIKLELSQDTPLLTTTEDANAIANVTIEEGSGLKNNLNKEFSGSAKKAINDKIAPVLVNLPSKATDKLYTSDFTYNEDLVGEPAIRLVKEGSKYYVEVYYSEKISIYSLSDDTFELNGNWEIVKGQSWETPNVAKEFDVTTKTAKVRFEVVPKLGKNYTYHKVLSVRQKSDVKDTKNNVLAASDFRKVPSNVMESFSEMVVDRIALTNALTEAYKRVNESGNLVDPYLQNDFTNIDGLDSSKKYVKEADKNTLKGVLDTAKEEKDKADDETTVAKLKEQKEKVEKAVEVFDKAVKQVAPATASENSQATKVAPSLKTDGSINLSAVTQTLYYELASAAKKYELGKAVSEVSTLKEVKTIVDGELVLSGNTKLNLVTVEDGKIKSSETVDLTQTDATVTVKEKASVADGLMKLTSSISVTGDIAHPTDNSTNKGSEFATGTADSIQLEVTKGELSYFTKEDGAAPESVNDFKVAEGKKVTFAQGAKTYKVWFKVSEQGKLAKIYRLDFEIE